MTSNQHARPGTQLLRAVVVLAAVLVGAAWPGLRARRFDREVEQALANVREIKPLPAMDPDLLEEMAHVTSFYPQWGQR